MQVEKINKPFRDNIFQAPFSPDYGMDYPVVQCVDELYLLSLPALIRLL